jgi:hypothetical protein
MGAIPSHKNPTSHRHLVFLNQPCPVYWSAQMNLTIPIPGHPGDVPKGTLRTNIREMGISVEEFNAL